MFLARAFGCVLSKEPWCRSKESLVSRWLQVVTVEGADPSGESFPAHQIPSFITAGWKHMLRITQQRSPAASTEPGHGTDHHTLAAATASAQLGDSAPRTPPSLGCDKLGKGRDLVQRNTTHSQGVCQKAYSIATTFIFPISCLYEASLCIKIQDCPTTPAPRAPSSTDEADACLANLSPSSWIPTGLHSELA